MITSSQVMITPEGPALSLSPRTPQSRPSHVLIASIVTDFIVPRCRSLILLLDAISVTVSLIYSPLLGREFLSIHLGTSNALKKILYAYNIFSMYIRLRDHLNPKRSSHLAAPHNYFYETCRYPQPWQGPNT